MCLYFNYGNFFFQGCGNFKPLLWASFCFIFPLAIDFIVLIFATIILYTSVNFLQDSVFHIARSFHSPFYATYPTRSMFPNQSVWLCVVVVQLWSCVWLCNACQPHLPMGFPRQEYWSGLLCPPPVNLPYPGIKSESPAVPALQVDSLLLSHQRSPREQFKHPGMFHHLHVSPKASFLKCLL